MGNARVVRHVDRCLFCSLEKLCFVLHRQHRLSLGRLASNIRHAGFDSTREPLITILTLNLKHDTLTTLFYFLPQTRDLRLDAHRCRPIPDPLTPPLLSTVEIVRPIVGTKFIRLPMIQRGNGGILNTVRDAADGGAKVRAVVGGVVCLGRKALHDVGTGDVEGLKDRAEGEEGDLIGGRHFEDVWPDRDVGCVVILGEAGLEAIVEEGFGGRRLNISSTAEEDPIIVLQPVIGAQIRNTVRLKLVTPQFRLFWCWWIASEEALLWRGFSPLTNLE